MRNFLTNQGRERSRGIRLIAFSGVLSHRSAVHRIGGAPRRHGPYSSSQRATSAYWREEMTTIETTIGQSKFPQPLLSAGARLAAGVSVVALVSIAWLAAGNASRDALKATS